MREEFVPTIRLSIEGIKQQIVSAMGIYGSELEAVISREIDEQLNNLQVEIKQIIFRTIEEEITKEIKRYFLEGDGNKAIKKAVKQSFKIHRK